MYEILRFKNLNVNSDKEVRDFRIDVKRRLNIPYQVGVLNNVSLLR